MILKKMLLLIPPLLHMEAVMKTLGPGQNFQTHQILVAVLLANTRWENYTMANMENHIVYTDWITVILPPTKEVLLSTPMTVFRIKKSIPRCCAIVLVVPWFPTHSLESFHKSSRVRTNQFFYGFTASEPQIVLPVASY